MFGYSDSYQENVGSNVQPQVTSTPEETTLNGNPIEQPQKGKTGTDGTGKKPREVSTPKPTPTIPTPIPNPPKTKPKEPTVKPRKIQAETFFKKKLCLDYDKKIFVPYDLSKSTDQQPEFPIVRVPAKGCAIKYPVQGRGNLRGACEREFHECIVNLRVQTNFYDDLCLFYGCDYPYEPDFAYIDACKGVFVDIEIDEPYSGAEKKPLHYCCNGNKTIDDVRNERFAERGWTVVRFSEKQIHEQCESCLKFLYELLVKMDASISIPLGLRGVADLKEERMWTERDANNKIRQREREKYLGISDFVISTSSSSPIAVKDYPQGKSIETNIARAKREERQWQLCSTVEDYARYISTHPFGKHVSEAKMKKANLERKEKERQDEERRAQEARRKKEQEESLKRQREAAQYEHHSSPSTISTNTEPARTPSSRGYA